MRLYPAAHLPACRAAQPQAVLQNLFCVLVLHIHHAFAQVRCKQANAKLRKYPIISSHGQVLVNFCSRNAGSGCDADIHWQSRAHASADHHSRRCALFNEGLLHVCLPYSALRKGWCPRRMDAETARCGFFSANLGSTAWMNSLRWQVHQFLVSFRHAEHASCRCGL